MKLLYVIYMFALHAINFLEIDATPARIRNGKAKGYVGGITTPPRGDLLTTTYCYCEAPPLGNRSMAASYYQFDYYNFHSNATFIINHTCLQDDDDFTNCLGAKVDRQLCRSWLKPQNDEEADTLCFTLASNRNMTDHQFIHWNHQTRSLSENGHQHRIDLSEEIAAEVCEPRCQRHIGSPVLKGHVSATSHGEAFVLDDMCPTCGSPWKSHGDVGLMGAGDFDRTDGLEDDDCADIKCW